MKKLIFCAILLVGMSTMAFSQEDGAAKKQRQTPEQRAQFMADGLSKKLSLSEQQKTEIYNISLENAKKAQEKRAAGERPDREAMKAQMEATDAKINAVLTEAQRKTYQQFKEDRKKGMQEGGAKHGKKPQKS